MKKKFIILAMFIFALSFLYAKRTPPPEVPFIIHDGYEYIADYSEGIFSGRGQILVRSVKNSKISNCSKNDGFFLLIKEIIISLFE